MRNISEEWKSKPDNSEEISKFRKVLRMLTKFMVYSSLLVIFAVFLTLGWIYTGDRSIPFVTSYTTKLITDILPENSSLEIEDIYVTLDNGEIVFKVKKPVIKNTEKGNFELSEVDLKLNLMGFFPQSNQNILDVEISDPKLNLNKLLNIKDDQDKGDFSASVKIIKQYLDDNKKQLVKLSLSLNNTKFLLNITEEKNLDVRINYLEISPKIVDGNIMFAINGDINIAGNSNIVDLSFNISDDNEFLFSGKVQNISSLLLKEIGMNLNEIEGSNIEVDLLFDGKTSGLRSIDYSKFTINNIRGFIAKNKYFSEDLHPDELHLKGELFNGGKKILIKDVLLKFDQSELKGELSYQSDKIESSINLNNLPAEKLFAYWPNSLISRTKQSIKSYVNEGLITKAIIKLNLDLNTITTDKPMHKDAYKIDLDIENAKVNLDIKLPLITGVSANVNINADQATIKTKGASIANVEIGEAVTSIKRLRNADSSLDFNGDLKGDAGSMINLASYFFNSEEVNKLKKSKGDVSLSLNLKDFLLYGNELDPAKLNVNLTGKAKNFSNSELFKNYPLSSKEFAFKYNDNILNIVGDFNTSEVSDIKINADFDFVKGARNIQANKEISVQDMAKFGLKLPEQIKGPFDAFLVLKQEPNGEAKITAKLLFDQTNVGVNYLNSFGGENAKGSLSLNGTLVNEVVKINSYNINTDNLKSSGRIVLDNNYQVKSVKSSKTSLGSGNFGFEYTVGANGDIQVSLNGDSFDYKMLNIDNLKKIGGDVNGNSNGVNKKTNAAIDFKFANINMYNNQVIKDAALAMKSDANGLQELKFIGYLDGTAIKLDFSNPRAVVNVPKFGDFLRGLNLYDRMDGGVLFSSGFFTEKKGFTGDLVITNFKVRKVPVLAKIISLSSVTLTSFSTLEDLIKGKGLQFDKLAMNFHYAENNLQMNDLVLKGPSLAILANGEMKISGDLPIVIKGLIIPENIINQAAKNIPILNKLLGVDQEGGEVLGINFKVTGPVSDPKAKVDPLSIFAPGLLKKLF